MKEWEGKCELCDAVVRLRDLVVLKEGKICTACYPEWKAACEDPDKYDGGSLKQLNNGKEVRDDRDDRINEEDYG